jgi:hypothetical protein
VLQLKLLLYINHGIAMLDSLKRIGALILPLLGILFSNTLEARNPYHATVTVDGFSTKFSESTILNLIRDLETHSIQRRIAIYTTNLSANFDLNLRGLEAAAAFAANSTTLTVTIPQAGITQSFTGSTREESLKLFDQFYKNDRASGKRKRRAYAKFTPIDPIAGNPNSLMGLMSQADYLLGRLSPLSGCSPCWTAQPIRHQFQAGFNTGRAFADQFDTSIYTLPLRYSYSPLGSWALVLDTPATVLINGRAISLNTSLGAGFRIPIVKSAVYDWSVTPVTRFGLGIAIDLSTGGSFISTGAVSTFNCKIRDYVLTMTNYASYLTSTALHAGGINFDYHLYNFIFKNGLTLTTCKGIELLGKSLNFSLSYENSAFTGSSLFIEHYNEIGIAIITTHVNPHLCYDCLSLGATYQFGQRSYKGYTLDLAYQF